MRKKFVHGLPTQDRPEWYNKKRPRSMCDSPKKIQLTLDSHVQQKMSSQDVQNFEDLLGMHWFVTGTPLSRMEEPHLLKALKVLSFLRCSLFFFFCVVLLSNPLS
jgi:hypothetical protein